MDKQKPFIMINLEDKILRDKNISPKAMLIYGEIYSICNSQKVNYCYAGDGHFAEMLGISKRMVQYYMAQLENSAYIYRSTERGYNDRGERGTWRTIFISGTQEEDIVNDDFIPPMNDDNLWGVN